jgi:undecaprenyl-diphosphatase
LILANSWRGRWLDTGFLGLTRLGSLILLLPLVILAAVLLWRRGFRDDARFLIAALAGASLLAQIAKHLVLRPRPELFVALTPVASPLSFPSAHAAQATAVVVALLLVLVPRITRHRRWWAPTLVSMAVLVGGSRVYLQVHFPSDVLAGTIATVFWVLGLRALMPWRINA